MPDPDPPAFTPAATIDPTALERFLAHCERRTISRKHPIIRKDDPAATLYYLISGHATVLLEDEDTADQEIIPAYLNCGDFIGEIGLFCRSSNRSTLVHARSDCELAQIRYTALNGRFETKLKDVHTALLHAMASNFPCDWF